MGKLFIQSYGCAMNFSDSEIVASILKKEGYSLTNNYQESDLILLNTCSIREKAEETIRKRLKNFNNIKKRKPSLIIGVLGCMAERLKEKLLNEERIVEGGGADCATRIQNPQHYIESNNIQLETSYVLVIMSEYDSQNMKIAYLLESKK